MRRAVSRLALSALVVWAMIGCVSAAVANVRRPRWNPKQAALWHLEPGNSRVQILRHFLRSIDAVLPERARLAVAVPTSKDDEADAMFRYLWIAYLLPRHQTVPAWRAGATPLEFWASFRGAGTVPATAVEVARWPEGVLYRMTSAIESPAGDR
jgi:hypothetical protein